MRSSLPLLLCLAFGGCDDGERSITVRFAPKFGDRAFSCAWPIDGVGVSKSQVEVRDFRMYVSRVELVAADGTRVPLALIDDDRWQGEGIALLDFEDNSGTCMTGSAGTNFEVRGTAPAGDYTGIAFTVGLPEENNHLDAATAPAPFNAQGMWWSWSGGYKYIKIDMRPAGQEEYFFHLGATACDGTIAAGFTCEYGNRPEVVLDGFDPDASEVIVDAGAIFAGVDVDKRPDLMTDTLPGCMAFPGDPECVPMLGSFGLTYLSNEPAAEQRIFTIGAR